jgi:hypothetical protein
MSTSVKPLRKIAKVVACVGLAAITTEIRSIRGGFRKFLDADLATIVVLMTRGRESIALT